uniref:Annexin n=1 Tax=Syphacia muris TaxID=451379 RepID=A0A0N5AX43_9BILA
MLLQIQKLLNSRDVARIESQSTSLYPLSSLGYSNSNSNYSHQPSMNYSQNPNPPYPSQQPPYPNQPAGGYMGQQGGGYPGGYPNQSGGYPNQSGGYPYPGYPAGGYQPPQGGYQPPGGYQLNQGGYPGHPAGFQLQPSYPGQQPLGGSYPGSQPKYPSNNSGQFGGGQQLNSGYNPNGSFGSGSKGMSSGTPTIRSYPSFNANADAEALRKAMKGFGCDKSKIIAVLCARCNSQRQQIATAFKAMYGKDLRKELKSELSGDFEDLILGLMDLPVNYDAYHLHKAIAGIGTKESVLIEIMCSRTNSEINEIKRVYRQLYKQELERDIVGDTSGYFQRLLKTEKNKGNSFDVLQDAHALHRAGEQRLGTDETCFNAILAAQNYAQLRLVFQEYQKITGHPIEKAIEAEFSGDIKDGLLAVVACVQNRHAYFAKLLYESMVGLGTRDTDLIRLIVTRSEIDLADVKREFQTMYKKSLVSMIKDDCSGAYKDGLVAIVNGNLPTDMNYNQQPYPSYPNQQPPYPPNQPNAGYPNQYGGYPNQTAGGYPNPAAGGYPGYPPNTAYPPQQNDYYNQMPGGYQPQPGFQQNPSYQPYSNSGPNMGNPNAYPQPELGQQFGVPQHNSGMSSGTPTIRPHPSFNANSDAETLHKAMKGFGCSKGKIVDVLCARSNSQRQQIATTFKAMYGKDLRNELESELSGDFEDLILGLMEPPAVYDAHQLHKAIAQLGTKESVLIEIMCSRTNSQINEIKQAYKHKYGNDLERDVVGDTSGYFQRLLVSMCAAGRDESMRTDQLKANQDAHSLRKAGEQRLGTDETCFNAILAAQNYAQLRLVFQEYQKITGHPIEKAIEAEFSGDIKDGLLAVVACVQNRHAYFAKLLYESMVGLGTRDTDLIRLIVTRSEIDLADVKREFQTMYKKSLVSMIKDDCSGAYKDGLVAIVNGN